MTGHTPRARRSSATAAVIAARRRAAAARPGAETTSLRVAMGSPGEAQIRVWDDVAAQFEAAHPGHQGRDELPWTTTCTRRSACRHLLAGRNAPDVYFEWTGERLAQRNADGYAADLTEAVTTGPLKGLFDDARLRPGAPSTARW